MILLLLLFKPANSDLYSKKQSLVSINYRDFEQIGNWIESSVLNGLTTEDPGSILRFYFEGSGVQVIGKLFNEDSKIKIAIDGVSANITWNQSNNTDDSSILFSRELSFAKHLMEIITIRGKILINAAKIIKPSFIQEKPGLQGLYDQKYTVQFYNMNSSGIWDDNTGYSTTSSGGYKEFSFFGTKFLVYVKYDQNLGNLKITLDEADISTVSTSGTPASTQKMIYESDVLPYMEHVVRLTCISATIGISYCEYIGHAPYSIFTQSNYMNNSGFSVWRNNWHGIGSNNLAAYIQFIQVCHRVVVYGRLDIGNGKANIIFDGKNHIVDTKSTPTINYQILFDSGDLDYISHNVTIKPVSDYTQINGITCHTGKDSGIFSFKAGRNEIYSGSALYLKLSRTGDHVGNYSFKLITKSEKDETFFKPLNISILFLENESEQIFKLETNYVNTETLNYSITCEIDNSENIATFANKKVEITVMCFNIPSSIQTITYEQFNKSNDWTSSGLGGVAGVGATASAKFNGTYLMIYGKVGPTYGKMELTIDSNSITIDNHDYGDIDTFLYVFPYLIFGEHDIKMECIDGKIGLNHLMYSNMPQYGTLYIDRKEYEINKGMSFLLKIARLDGITGKVSCQLNIKNIDVPEGNIFIDSSDNNGAAVYPSRVINFGEGVIAQEVRILTNEFNSSDSKNYSFEIELINPGGGVDISSIKKTTTVAIIDDVYPSDQIFEVPFQDMEQKTNWTPQIDDTGGGWTSTSKAYKEMSFVGVRAYIYGFVAFNHGLLDILIDDIFVTTINTTGKTRRVRYLLYVSPILKYGQHKIRAQQNKGNVGLSYFRYYDNMENGLFNFEKKEYYIEKNGTVYINIIRTHNNQSPILIRVEPLSGGNATTNEYIDFRQNIQFNAGDSSKFFNIISKLNRNAGVNYTVKAKLVRFIGTIGTIGSNFTIDVTITDPIYPLNNMVQIPYDELSKSNEWISEDKNYGGYSNVKDNYIEATFTGVKAFLYTYVSVGHGDCNITLDGKEIGFFHTYSLTRSLSTLLYVTPELDYGEHILRVTVVSFAVGVNFVSYLTGFNPTHQFSYSEVFSKSNTFESNHEASPYSEIENQPTSINILYSNNANIAVSSNYQEIVFTDNQDSIEQKESFTSTFDEEKPELSIKEKTSTNLIIEASSKSASFENDFKKSTQLLSEQVNANEINDKTRIQKIGKIVGIIVGVIIALVCVLLIICFILRRRTPQDSANSVDSIGEFPEDETTAPIETPDTTQVTADDQFWIEEVKNIINYSDSKEDDDYDEMRQFFL